MALGFGVRRGGDLRSRQRGSDWRSCVGGERSSSADSRSAGARRRGGRRHGSPAPGTLPAPAATLPWVASCPAAPVGAWEPPAPPTGSFDDLRAYAEVVRASFTGHWTGTQSIFATTPTVAFAFDASGHYSGICLGTQCWATIYKGTDNKSPAKRYRLDDMSLDGVSSGNIDLAFPPQLAMGEHPSDPRTFRPPARPCERT